MRILKHTKDIIKIAVAFTISSCMKLNKNNKDIWLISERKDEAEDNGYHLYKYIRENHPEQKVFYLINKKSPAYSKSIYQLFNFLVFQKHLFYGN